MYQDMVDNWPMEQERSRRLARSYKQVFDEVGESRFARAVKSIRDSRSYASFPTLAEFRSYLPIPDAPASGKHYCALCSGNTWVYCEERDEMNNQQVKRCPNWLIERGLVARKKANEQVSRPQDERVRKPA
jgi:hypothetical protein